MTDFVQFVFQHVAGLGFWGIALGLMVEVIPSELVLSYGGYLIHTGKLHFLSALVAGILGGTIAQLFLYWLGFFGGRPFLEKYGKWFFIQKHHLDMAETWFKRYGVGVIFSARFVPIVRHAISIPAGISKMPLSTFTLYTIAAMIPWTVLFLLLGIQLGEHWNNIEQFAKPFLTPIITIALLSALGYLLFEWRKSNKEA